MRRASIAFPFLAALMLNATTLRAAVIAVSDAGVEVSGEIVEGDAARLAADIDERKRASGSTVTVLLNSHGGSVLGGVDAADAIRKAEANTIVGQNATCASACFLLFLAGKEKIVFQGGRVGIHCAGDINGKENLASLGLSTILARIYKAQGVPDNIIVNALTTPPDEIYWLTPDDLQSLGVRYTFVSTEETPPSSQSRSIAPPLTVSPSAPPQSTPSITWDELFTWAQRLSAEQNNGTPDYQESCQPELQVCSYLVAFNDQDGIRTVVRRTVRIDDTLVERGICQYNLTREIRTCVNFDTGIQSRARRRIDGT